MLPYKCALFLFVHFTDWAEKGKPDSVVDPSNKGKDLIHFHFKEASLYEALGISSFGTNHILNIGSVNYYVTLISISKSFETQKICTLFEFNSKITFFTGT